MRAVEDPSKFIKANVESTSSGLRHLLRQMQSRKRIGKTGKAERAKLGHACLSAFERTMIRRKGGDSLLDQVQESPEEVELRKYVRLADQTQKIPGSYQRYASVQKPYSGGTNTVGVPSLRGSVEQSLNATRDMGEEPRQIDAMMLQSNDYNGRFLRKQPGPR